MERVTAMRPMKAFKSMDTPQTTCDNRQLSLLLSALPLGILMENSLLLRNVRHSEAFAAGPGQSCGS